MTLAAPSIIKVGQTLTIIMSGKIFTIDQSVKNYQDILELIKNKDWDNLPAALDIAIMVVKQSNGRAEVADGVVFLDGVPVHTSLSERIVDMLQEGWPVEPMLRFLENVSKNPADYSKEELYLFLEKNRLPITEDGCFLAYKVVKDDYMDCHTGTIRNAIGDKPQMKREEVDPIRDHHCSRGLHFCSLGYIQHFGGSNSRLMIVKINPADVVSIPSDYQNTKGRCWTYEVVDEIKMGTQATFDETAPACLSTELSLTLTGRVAGWVADLGGRMTSNYQETLEACGLVAEDVDELLEFAEEELGVEGLEDQIDITCTIEAVAAVLQTAIDQDDAFEEDSEGEDDELTYEDLLNRYNLSGDITGNDLFQVRNSVGVTGAALARHLGVRRSAIWSYDNTLAPKQDTVHRILVAIYELEDGETTEE
jgi:hypothetical protein